MLDEREMIKLVNDVDNWAQENNRYADGKFQSLYSGNEGWKGVFNDKPANFFRAYVLALDYKEAAGY